LVKNLLARLPELFPIAPAPAQTNAGGE